MSPLTRLTLTPLTTQARAVAGIRASHGLRGAVPSVTRRGISSTTAKDMRPMESTKDTLKKADRVVSDAAVKGIDKGGMSPFLVFEHRLR